MSGYQFVIVWEYQVKPGRETEFEQAYGPVGDWVRLFSQHPGYLRTELQRDPANLLHYRTVDVWKSADDFNAFKELYLSEYELLDRMMGDLTESETLKGYYLTEM